MVKGYLKLQSNKYIGSKDRRKPFPAKGRHLRITFDKKVGVPRA